MDRLINLCTTVNKELDTFDPSKYWNPMIEIENAVGEIKSDVTYKIVIEKNDPSPIIYEMRKVKGTFLENLELYDFPVDVQVIICFSYKVIWYSYHNSWLPLT